MPEIRLERPADESGIHHLVCQCFPTAGEADLVVALRASRRLIVSLVAVDADQVVGHVAFSPVTSESGQGGLGLAPLAVAPNYRGRGVAAELVRQGLDECRKLNHGWVVLLGEPDYYGRFGFQPANRFGLSDEYGGGAAFQALELQPDSLNQVQGLVRYAPEFAALG